MAGKEKIPEMIGAKDDVVEIDEVSGVETTGHEWDGIKELNTPMPRWWLWTFYGTVLFSLVYTIAYPAWPLVNEATEGVLGWSSRGALIEEIEAAEQAKADRVDAIENASVEEILDDEALRQFAVAGGSAAFKVNCVQCHGSGAAGSPGYPNLNDDDWIWGGTIDAIHTTIRHGVRNDQSDEARFSDMPAFGADEILSREEIADTAAYVRTLAGEEADSEAATRGETLYADNCAACHGEAGEGVEDLGAPRLSDGIWLYGGSAEAIASQISKPRHGVMPAWEGRLSEATLKQLAVYIHSLGGGMMASEPEETAMEETEASADPEETNATVAVGAEPAETTAGGEEAPAASVDEETADGAGQ